MDERWQTSQGLQGPRNDTVVSPLGLLFASYYSRFGDEGAGNLEITTDCAGIKKIIHAYHEQLYTHKFSNFDEVDHFLKKHKQP